MLKFLESAGPTFNEQNISSIAIPLVAALIGALTYGFLQAIQSRRQSRREYRSLILAFAYELTLAFERCVIYYGQATRGEVSYSALFAFTDASSLVRLASVASGPEVVAAIVDLKSIYFQIGRHVEQAAIYATEADQIAENSEQKIRLRQAAHHAQGVALAFFRGNYEKTAEETALIIREAKKWTRCSVVGDLEKSFEKAKNSKKLLDKSLPNQGASTQNSAQQGD